MTPARTAVVLMAYGTPRSRDEILPYYTDIRRGRPPTDEQLADLSRRYDAIGGLSPLRERTEAQRRAVQAALEELAPGRCDVRLGFKHAAPMIEDTVESFATDGFTELVALVLAPHYSRGSIGQYHDRARASADQAGMSLVAIDSWATEPAYIEFISRDLGPRLEKAPEPTTVVFTAHSLPERVVADGDPYCAELLATAEAVAASLGLATGDWSIAWQSASRTPDSWLTPTLLDTIADIGSARSAAGTIICACGFVADHLEVLYDVDIEARGKAEELGLYFDRTACVNDDPAVMAALAARVIAAGDAR